MWKYYIYTLKNYKSLKSIKNRHRQGVIGGLLVVTGIATALNNFAVKDKVSKQRLLISGGVQFLAGLSLGISSSTKSYNFKEGNKPWRID